MLGGIADRLGKRLRAARRVCRTVVLRLRFDDFSRATRSHTLSEATANTETILVAARRLLHDVLPMVHEKGITLIGLTLANLDNDDAIQLMLPFDSYAGEALDTTLDELRERFGNTAVMRAALLGRDQGMSVPLLPD